MYKKTYPASVIIKCLSSYEKIKSFRKVAQIQGVSKSTIHRWWVSLHALRKRNRLQKKKIKRKSKYQNLVMLLEQTFADETLKYFTLQQIKDKITETTPSLSTISRALKKAKISRRRFERSKVCPRSTHDMITFYTMFQKQLKTYRDDEIICIDETYLSNIGHQTYGYFRKGKTPQVINIPKRRKYSIIMALSSSKVITAEKQKDAFTKSSFNTFILDKLVPMLDSNVKVLLMDNVAFHKNKDLLNELEKRRITCLYIPPYSPRCNPIEEFFSVMKRRFQRSYDVNTFDDNVSRIIQEMITYDKLSGFYRHTRDHVQQYLENLKTI
jgi:transposase